MIDEEHARNHAGELFSVWGYNLALANNASIEFLYVVGAKQAHVMATTRAGGDLEAFLFEGTVVSANGTPATISNRNRASAMAPTTALYQAPTITSDGNRIDGDLILGGTGGVAPGTTQIGRVEWIFKPNTIYLGRLKNISGQAQKVAVRSEWYERLVV